MANITYTDYVVVKKFLASC